MPEDRAVEPDSKLAEQLQRLLLSIEACGGSILSTSNDELLQTIVEAAARLFGAAAASIALVNEKEQSITFRVAFGAGRDQVVGMQIPMDQGIAGYCVMTGQPMAISNVQQDQRFARNTAEQTGYVPRSILAMPLLLGDRVIGVMEVLDKIDAAGFGMQDMELLALFSKQAAIAIEQSQQMEGLNEALVRGIKQLVSQDLEHDWGEITQVVESSREGTSRQYILELAGILNRMAGQGEAERRVCLQVLQAFGQYTSSKPGY